jgi:2-polyprenyl-3-methyl-5-hydroxy-6-metoxy-1,4-benzoquinol methylase
VKQLDTSPINNSPLEPYISCKDYTVSNETFSIVKDKICELLVTSPRPNDESLGDYYESDDYISHSDARKSVFDRVYQLVRNYTLKQKIKLINSFSVSEKRILDIGAGTGDFLVACKENGWNVEGVEPSSKARGIAEHKLAVELKTEISKISGQQFDVITMWHVLEHVSNLNEYVHGLKGLLKENGRLIVAVPNHKSFDASHYGNCWAAYDVPRHLWHFSQKSIDQLFQKENMEVIKTLPMKFDAFYVSLLSEKYKNGRMNLAKAFYIGLQSNLKAKVTKEYSSLIYVIKKA